MAYIVKDEYKDYKPINMNISYGELLPHQIKNLSEEVKKKYFTNTTKSKKKKKVVEDDLDFIGGNNGD
tara:strand:+ start:397 stop:600 length:204 start_codon:yes stop_codon:yes gene_type:complete